MGVYGGERSYNFTILPCEITENDVSVTGNEVTIVKNGETLVEGKDFTVAYSNNSGTGTATINGIGNYCETVEVEYTLEDDNNQPDDPEYNYTFSIQTPSMTIIRHKDGIKLHANIEGTAPAGSYVVWTADNNKFKTEEINNGNSLKIISDSNGKTTFTATLYSANGEVLATDSIEMKSKAGFFDKIGSFFRSLFGGTKIYEN